MAVTIQQIAAELRLNDGSAAPPEPQFSILTRAHATALELVLKYAPDAPEDAQDSAVIRVVAYMYDTNPSGSRMVDPNPMLNSGATAILDLWRRARTRRISRTGVTPGPTPPSGGLTIDQIRRLLLAENVFAEESAFTAYIGANNARIAAIRQVVDPTGIALGRVLTITADGVYGWAAIGEAQIEAAIEEYLMTHDVGISPRQLAEALAPINTKVSSNTSAIAKNLTDLATERGRITALADLTSVEVGSIGISPNTIPNKEAVIRDYAFAYEDLPVAWLNSKRCNSFDVWFKNRGIHAVRNWTPVEDGVVTVNVNENEARAIGIGENETIIPVRMVFLVDGFTAVGIKNTWLEIRPTGSPTIDELKAEIDLRQKGDNHNKTVIVGEDAATANANLVTFLNAQANSDNTGLIEIEAESATDGVTGYARGDMVIFPPKSKVGKIIGNNFNFARAGFNFLFNTVGSNADLNTIADGQRDDPHGEWLRVTADFTYAAQSVDYKTDDILWLPPYMPLRAGVRKMWNVGGGSTFELSQAQQIGLLTFEPSISAIPYASGGLEAALTRTVSVVVVGAELLEGDIWVEGQIDGQAAITRRKWTSTTSKLDFIINQALARRIGQNSELTFDIIYYDAANAGNIVRTISFEITLVQLTAIIEYANQAAAVAAGSPANTIQWWPAS